MKQIKKLISPSGIGWYHVTYFCKDGYLAIPFEVRSVEGFLDKKPLFPKENGSLPTENEQESEIMIRGSIKWDGCSNIEFPASQSCMHHECDRVGLTDIGILLGRIYDQCAELMKDRILDGDIGNLPVINDPLPWEK